jgi:anti-sigma-K factor RskA
MDCRDLAQFYEEYALGVLEGEAQDAEVRAEIEAHLARKCPRCTAGVERARWLVSQLAYAAPPQQPPAAIRARIVQAVASEPSPQRKPQLSPRRIWIPAWAWAAAALLVAFAGYSLYENWLMHQQIDQLAKQVITAEGQQQALEQQRDTYNKAMAILAAPGTKKMEMKPSSEGMPMLEAFVHEKMGVVVAARGVPMPPSGRAFQLWMVPKPGMGNPISAGVYMPDASGAVLTVSPPPSDMSDMAALAVTEEPSAGSPQPTSKPMWLAPLQ